MKQIEMNQDDDFNLLNKNDISKLLALDILNESNENDLIISEGNGKYLKFMSFQEILNYYTDDGLILE